MNLSLKIDWCTYAAAEYAIKHWHYSQSMPSGRLVKLGVWEDNKFIGCILFGRGANYKLASGFGLEQTECVELVRIALTNHITPVTKLVSIAIRMLKKHSPGLKLVVSYADTKQGHDGIIYQAGNWIYLGKIASQSAIDPETGEVKHRKTLHSKYGSVKGFTFVDDMPKHKYAYPLTKEMRVELESKAVPFQGREGGAVPTSTHHLTKEE